LAKRRPNVQFAQNQNFIVMFPSFCGSGDQSIRRAIVSQLWLGATLRFGNDALRKDLAQFNAPLIKRIDVPYDPLSEDAVLVERNQFAENGVNRSIMIVFEGRVPSNTRWGTSQSGVPSAFTRALLMVSNVVRF
jgi:hypothetical protein